MDSQDEKLSLLMDDELDALAARRLLARMQDDPGLRASWQHYHLIRQGLRGESSALADGDFAARVSQQVAAEPLPLPLRNQRREWLKPLMGLALAASLSILAVLSAREYGAGQLPYWPDSGVASGAANEVQLAGYGLLSQEKLQAYMVMHHESVYSAGAGDMMLQAPVSVASP